MRFQARIPRRWSLPPATNVRGPISVTEDTPVSSYRCTAIRSRGGRPARRRSPGGSNVARITMAPGGATNRRAPVRTTRGRTTASRWGRITGLLAAVVPLLALALPGVAGADVTAPHDVITFPQRDFVSASGFAIADRYTVEVLHPNSVTPVGTVTGITPVEDPATPGVGVIEVNHPGGACWVGTTPDIRAGDTI